MKSFIYALSVSAIWGFVFMHCSSLQAADYLLLVGGMGGEEKYSEEFAGALSTIKSVLTEKYDYQTKNVSILSEDADSSSTLSNIQEEIQSLKSRIKESDTLLLILIGHGQSDHQHPKFNLPGEDLSALELRRMLSSLPAKDQRLILSFPCSGHFTEFLSSPTRVILASTDGPRQIYHTKMTQYLIEALDDDYVDNNYDGEVSFYELFEFLSEQVEGYFVAQGSLQTENPSLDDNGDGRVTTLAEGMDSGDGANAKQVIFIPAPSSMD